MIFKKHKKLIKKKCYTTYHNQIKTKFFNKKQNKYNTRKMNQTTKSKC